MSLYYLEFGDTSNSSPPLIIVHGLFGSSLNWRSIARQLSEQYHVYVIDQRNHGQSPHHNSMTYSDMVADLHQFIIEHNLRKIYLCGHSMGGKTAMLFALQYPELVEKLAVLDIAPVAYTHSYNTFLDTLMSIDLMQIKSRGEAEKLAQKGIPDMATRLFLMQSLVHDDKGYVWRLNLPVLKKYMSQIIGFPMDSITGKEYSGKSLFLYGEDSDYVQPQHYAIIKQYFSNCKINGIVNAGHWLHVEQGKQMIISLQNFLKK